jgi:hypothetical protein
MFQKKTISGKAVYAVRAPNFVPRWKSRIQGQPVALQLHGSAALRYPGGYKRIEWWDPREGKLLDHSVGYSQLAHAAAFVCTDRTCSPPIADPEKLRAKINRLTDAERKADERKRKESSSEKATKCGDAVPRYGTRRSVTVPRVKHPERQEESGSPHFAEYGVRARHELAA